MRQHAWAGILLAAVLAGGGWAGCGPAGNARATSPARVILYGWVDYFPPAVLDAFTETSGLSVDYRVYETQDEAVANMRAGRAYDLVVLESDYLPSLIADGLVRDLDYRNIPNFRYVSANYRDLAYDPSNRHSVPYHWGTTGLLVRTDLVRKPVERWADLWDPGIGGKVAVWPIPNALIAIALLADGHAPDSTDPQDMADVARRLVWLRDHALVISNEEPSVVPYLMSGEAVAAYGWAYDAVLARQAGAPIRYVLPEEGALLWHDLLVVPVGSENPAGAERLINALLEPETSAWIVEWSGYAMANDRALELLDPATRDDPLIFPPPEDLENAVGLPPRSAEDQAVWDEVWAETLGRVGSGP